jgi:hypothetical protein
MQISAIPALASELSVTPSEAKGTFGYWSARSTGAAIVSLGVPGDMKTLASELISE